MIPGLVASEVSLRAGKFAFVFGYAQLSPWFG